MTMPRCCIRCRIFWSSTAPCGGGQLELAPYTKPMELLADIEAGVRFDVLFLDVLMPGINGINAAREIRRYDTAVQIIFVTSSSEFAVQSYVVGAYYYQLKPIWKDSFFRLTDAVLAECRKRTPAPTATTCATICSFWRAASRMAAPSRRWATSAAFAARSRPAR